MLVHDEVGLSICKFYLCACMFVYKNETRINLPLVFKKKKKKKKKKKISGMTSRNMQMSTTKFISPGLRYGRLPITYSKRS